MSMVEYQLRLCFLGENAELDQWEFRSPFTGERIQAYRGNTSGAHSGAASFKWTPGIRAWCLLFVRSLVAHLTGKGEEAPVLAGTVGSLAATLDYALYKKPLWLLDLFGCDTKGTTNAARLLKVTNPGQKRPGPVEFRLNTNIISPANIRIVWEGVALSEIESLGKLERKLTTVSVREDSEPVRCCLPEEWMAPAFQTEGFGVEAAHRLVRFVLAPLGNFADVHRKDLLRGTLCTLISQELSSVLSRNDIQSRTNLRLAINNPIGGKLFIKTFGSPERLISSVDIALIGKDCLSRPPSVSSWKSFLEAGEKFTVNVPPSLVGSQAIFLYLNLVRGIPLWPDIEIAFTDELISRACGVGPQLKSQGFVLTLPSATHFINSKNFQQSDFVPLMLLPRQTHRSIHKRLARRIGAVEHRLWKETPSSAAMIFGEAYGESAISSARHQNNLGVFSAFADGANDLEAVQSFPYYGLNSVFNDCVSESLLPGVEDVPSVMFVKKDVQANSSLVGELCYGIRHAWAAFQHTPGMADMFAQLIATQPMFCKSIANHSGIPYALNREQLASI